MVDSTCKPWKATSNGAWAGDNPVHFSLPLLTVQLCLILFFSRLFAFLMKPLRQPRVIAEIAVRSVYFTCDFLKFIFVYSFPATHSLVS